MPTFSSKFAPDDRAKAANGDNATVRRVSFVKAGPVYDISSDLAPSHTQIDVPEAHLTSTTEPPASSPQDAGVQTVFIHRPEATNEGPLDAEQLNATATHPDGVTPERAKEIEYGSGYSIGKKGGALPDSHSAAAKRGFEDAKNGKPADFTALTSGDLNEPVKAASVP